MPRVLVADDAPMVEGFLQEALKSAGHELVGVARTGKQAVELYGRLKPDLVTMDLNMPELDGMGALKQILSIDPAAKVIIITAMNHPILRADLMKAGAKESLGKPIRLDHLLRTVKDVLER